MAEKRKIEVCFSPAMYHSFHDDNSIIVIVDILRATTAMCTAFMNGAKSLIPVSTLEEAKEYKSKGYLVAAERDGIVCDFADFGNSPYNFQREIVEGKTIVYSTTNGTQAINMAKKAYKILVGSFLNISALASYITYENKDVIIFCSGWKDRFSLEDTLFAGALADKLLNNYNKFYTICDSAIAAIDLWSIARKDIMAYIEKAAQRHRLKQKKLDNVLEYCFSPDQTELIPYLSGEKLVVNFYCENNNNLSSKNIKIKL